MRSSSWLVLMGIVLIPPHASAQQAPTTWTFLLGARESNQFSRVQNGLPVEDRILDNANVGLRLATRSQRARVGLFGRVGANMYREGEQRDRTTFGGGLAWDYQPSERLDTSLTQNVSYGLRGQTLAELGVLAPDVNTTSAATAWNLQYRTSPRTTIYTNARYRYARLESSQAIEGSQLVLSDAPSDDIFPDISPTPSGDLDIPVPDAEDAIVQILATEGLSVRESTNQSAMGAFGLSSQLTERTTLGFDLTGGYRRIDSTRLRDGAESGGRFWAQRSVGAATQLNASYTLRRSLALEPVTTIQSVSGGGSHSPSSGKITFRLLGGASYFQAKDVKSVLTPTVDAAFSAAPARSSRLNASYRRQFRQSLGFGRTLLIDYVNASFAQDFGSHVTLTARAGGSFGTDPLEDDSRLDAKRAGATLRVKVLDPLSVGTSFYVLETEQRRGGSVNDSRRKLWSLFLNFTKTWH